jgi:dipeptidyl aminopeptidase/acylaminoacyl peptidase
MPELREVFEMTTKQKQAPVNSWREQQDRQHRRVRNKKLGALAVAAAIGLIAVVIGTVVMTESRTGGPATAPTVVNDPPRVSATDDFLVDPVSGARGALPESIAGGFAYHVSPDGTMIAYQGPADDPSVEAAIYVANIDGTDPRIVSPQGVDARWPSWAPDGSKIVYQAFVPSPKLGNLFVYDLTSGATTQITDLKQKDVGFYGWMNPTFASTDRVLFHLATGSTFPVERDLWEVSATGASEPKLVQKGASYADASPSGEIVFLTGVDEWTGLGISTIGHDQPLGASDAGGQPQPPTVPVVEGSGLHSPRWSPDGTKIAYLARGEVNILDMQTGQTSTVQITGLAELDMVNWYDDQTLIIDRY